MSELHEWDNFYVILGSAAGALIGLQFVVMTLIAERPTATSGDAARAFATPTIVHFSCCLLIAALICVPWPDMTTGACVGGAVGVCGLLYMTVILMRMLRQSAYRPDWEDWTFHIVLPFLAYSLLALSSLEAVSHARQALFGVGVTTLLLLFIGIHNAWDAVAYQVFVIRRRDADKD
ncbi:MAG TPA: hypothetical protein VHZ32_00150 [Rhizomicrobium sp.]|jgi:hypothetical protein|nr:hypothetical protein [Rhizomicrobium sp.]